MLTSNGPFKSCCQTTVHAHDHSPPMKVLRKRLLALFTVSFFIFILRFCKRMSQPTHLSCSRIHPCFCDVKIDLLDDGQARRIGVVS
eukprot:m.8646 g.8646  ORF g.8646 m.8646 type:complete len:87 (-) comp5382_c0_seq1:201-461(-)